MNGPMTGGQLWTPLLDVRDLTVSFRTPAGEVQAIRDVSFSVGPGELVGMVGESGSGKSVTGLSVLGLLPARSSRTEGQVLLDGRDILGLDERALAGVRGREISMIFQEPMTALDPVFTVGRQIAETLRRHRPVSRRAARARAVEMLGEVGIPAPHRRVDDYPHQLSGGMRQRAMIAMALVCGPRLLIADEPTTALDVTIQAQILELLRTISREHGTAVLLITHDLGVVAEVCQRLITMYAGEVVEQCPVDAALESPQHPYTSGLVRAVPGAGQRGTSLYAIPGRVPPLTDMPEGCRFRLRCEHAIDGCEQPQHLLPAGAAHLARCWRHPDLDLPGVVYPQVVHPQPHQEARP
ncbi:ABC transporter ATP-binding protein [Pseudonocardia nigra]|uniref:ABC transporter ATP-binding protein n=1 Tax=Pseudonocardia nigra TaxID=1921578 RepID=UPI001C5CD680|nr:ABC transporter ATP-binding protein [Pseudonocardia nigra]